MLNKQLNEKKRDQLREVVEREAVCYAVARMDAPDIDKYNILWASVRTMHKSLDRLLLRPDFIIVDGNRFLPYKKISFECIVKGDGKYNSIAAASILAKTYRDEYMQKLHKKFPVYQWNVNKGYPTEVHRTAIIQHGPCKYHRMTFRLYPEPAQMSFDFTDEKEG